jgi:hypothetical protein
LFLFGIGCASKKIFSFDETEVEDMLKNKSELNCKIDKENSYVSFAVPTSDVMLMQVECHSISKSCRRKFWYQDSSNKNLFKLQSIGNYSNSKGDSNGHGVDMKLDVQMSDKMATAAATFGDLKKEIYTFDFEKKTLTLKAHCIEFKDPKDQKCFAQSVNNEYSCSSQ